MKSKARLAVACVQLCATSVLAFWLVSSDKKVYAFDLCTSAYDDCAATGNPTSEYNNCTEYYQYCVGAYYQNCVASCFRGYNSSINLGGEDVTDAETDFENCRTACAAP